jgi:hypothetical protein
MNPIEIDLEMGEPITSHFDVGESSGVKKKKNKKMRGQVERNPTWMVDQTAGGECVYHIEDTYESLSSYFGMRDLCLGTSSDLDYIPT